MIFVWRGNCYYKMISVLPYTHNMDGLKSPTFFPLSIVREAAIRCFRGLMVGFYRMIGA